MTDVRKQVILISALLIVLPLATPVYALYTDAISREFSVYVDASLTYPTDAISREFSVYVDASSTYTTDAISREFSVYVDASSTYPTDAISREFSAYAGTAPVLMARQLPNSRDVSMTDAAVSAVFPGYFYLESLDRSSGVRVQWPSSVRVGDKLEVIGTTQTTGDFERFVAASSVVSKGVGQIGPLGMNNLAVGGGDFVYDALTGAGQRGIAGAAGLNNIGLMVNTLGRVAASGTDPRAGIAWAYVDDGSNVQDGTGVTGVYCEAQFGITPPAVGSQVSVSGISSCELYKGALVNVIRIRSLEDIKTISAPSGTAMQSTVSTVGMRPRDKTKSE